MNPNSLEVGKMYGYYRLAQEDIVTYLGCGEKGARSFQLGSERISLSGKQVKDMIRPLASELVLH
jgi:hypothetical protein